MVVERKVSTFVLEWKSRLRFSRSTRDLDASARRVKDHGGVTVSTLVFGQNELSMQQRQEAELACVWFVVCIVGKRIAATWSTSRRDLELASEQGGGRTLSYSWWGDEEMRDAAHQW
ncbi:hypothetical protein HN011_011944 [Eciton burchellii]|nr:hypothetical protein HN011_011944 [Eciton burchellii]